MLEAFASTPWDLILCMIDQDVYRIVRIIAKTALQVTTHCSESMLMAFRDAISRDVQVRKSDMLDCSKIIDVLTRNKRSDACMHI